VSALDTCDIERRYVKLKAQSILGETTMSPIKQQLLEAIDHTPDPLLEQLFALLQTLTPQPPSPTRAPFGALKDSGEILGDIVSPIVSLEDWDVLK
jgi:hypothetical protein